MSQQTNDPMDITEEPEVTPKAYFGEVNLVHNEMYWDYSARQLLAFNPQQHRAGDKLIQVKLDALCTRRDGSTYILPRNDIIEWPPSPWATIANKSLHKLGVHYTELEKGRWCKFELIKTGKTYVSDKTGETVENDFFSFLEFYADEATCRAAEATFYNRTEGPEDEPLPFESNEDAGKARAGAAVFLPTLWTLAQGDPDAFYTAILNQPSLTAHFGEIVEEIALCPEVVAIVEGGAE